MTTSAFVFARGGSKGLPRKNLLPICGLPLLAHSIKIAHDLSEVDHIYVSTDCDEIAAIATLYGAELILRLTTSFVLLRNGGGNMQSTMLSKVESL